LQNYCWGSNSCFWLLLLLVVLLLPLLELQMLFAWLLQAELMLLLLGAAVAAVHLLSLLLELQLLPAELMLLQLLLLLLVELLSSAQALSTPCLSASAAGTAAAVAATGEG
jgi:hypothetical protein